ncbi:hypothetical protein QNM97_06480 [Gordonia sp. L191]|uniref:hypothetical protein n=1 Tax=Gordonia sp. L191 TaxID=2982699 RepID=UPI0024BF3D2D|nr:hypothetical protein [Gordonia sp. L191]WHU48639.1 hypothetical protein QNM97_06480 [Gordonia sp. L191]
MENILNIVDSYQTPITTRLGGERRRHDPAYSYDSVTDYGPPATEELIDAVWSGTDLPKAVRDLWLTAEWIRLYYAEWNAGLIIFSPSESYDVSSAFAAENEDAPDDYYEPGDVIVGKFQSLDEALVYSPGRGWVVSDPYDPRRYWPHLGEDLSTFLEAYRDSLGKSSDWQSQFRRD